LDEALAVALRLVAVTQNSPVMRAQLARILARCGRQSEARALLAELEAQGPGLAFFRGCAWLALGEHDCALQALAVAESTRSNFLVFSAVDANLDELRADSSFAELIRRLGLEHVSGVLKPEALLA
jgi:hypothetical protein